MMARTIVRVGSICVLAGSEELTRQLLSVRPIGSAEKGARRKMNTGRYSPAEGFTPDADLVPFRIQRCMRRPFPASPV